MAVELMNHQEEGLRFLAGQQTAGLFFEMGLGKTITMLEHLKGQMGELKFSNGSVVKYSGNMLPCLIVCPLSVVSVWSSEVKKFEYPFSCIHLTGSRQARLKALESQADIYIINYDGLRVLGKELLKKSFKAIILDESHRIKEKSSLQSEVAMALSRQIPYRYILTGTPVTKSPEDVWNQLEFLEPGYLGNFYVFRNQYIDFKILNIRGPKGVRQVKKAYKFKNLTKLEEKLALKCLRKTKAECLDLPEKIYKTIFCEMTPEQNKAYYMFKLTLVTMINDHLLTTKSAASVIQKLRQICQGFVYDDNQNPVWFKENTKAKMLVDILEDIGEDKAIVFTWYKADIEMCEKVLTEAGYRVLVYDGDSDQRAAIVEEFQSTPQQVIFLSNIEKAKEGITLTAANHVIYYGNTYNFGSRSQSEDRAHRKGQKHNVIYYDLICPGTVDQAVHDILSQKKETADAVTGDAVRLAQMIASS